MSGTAVIVCAAVGSARGLDAAAAAVAVAATPVGTDWGGTVVLDLRTDARVPRGAVLAASTARSLELTCGERDDLRAAARGRLCFAALARPGDSSAATMLASFLADGIEPSLLVCLTERGDFRACLEAGASQSAALLRSSRGAERSLLALVSTELIGAGIRLKVWAPPIGLIAARRALAGLEPGGESGRRAARFAARLASPPRPPRARRLPGLFAAERAQALPAVLGVALVTIAVALILLAIGGAATAKGRLQRSVDLVALSAARSMRNDFPRLFVPAMRADGSIDPEHLERSAYLERARAAGIEAAARNDLDPGAVAIRFPDGASFAPLRVTAAADVSVEVDGTDAAATDARAEAEVSPPTGAASSAAAPAASGGGYSGELAYRQGKPMRPDVAEAFDRMVAAASRSGVSLLVNSGYRSDAEQQALWDANPDPRMVAPPGTSLHRCGTELDLGPPSGYGWLAANAGSFGFLQRYSWEAWHFGFTDGPEPCSAEAERAGGGGEPDGRPIAGMDLPSFVPARYRDPLIESASRHGVSAALLAAQIMAESNFNPAAVSPAGAQGIAQFMPATAAAYGLDDPFDPDASIDAQARMMAELLSRFGAVELALAAYNAGPGAVATCRCIPPYPETQAYVTRILGLLGGAGELVAPTRVLEVRLVA